MVKKKKPARGGARAAGLAAIRTGGAEARVASSGLEVWLYDEANLAKLRKANGPDEGAGGMAPGFAAKTKKGLIVGYSLEQDDDVYLGVLVGAELTEKELSVARWLEPQRAFLRLPSGALCVESNDASRLGPETPAERGVRVSVAPGDYRLTLHRLDREALEREGLAWEGPQEVVVLTPGGTTRDAAKELLPFEARRDTSWVGRYSVHGVRADVLIWFGDHWDTFVVNLDAAGLEKLGLEAGRWFRVSVADAKVTLASSFAGSWEDARRVPRPASLDVEDRGYGALSSLGEWNGAEALFCRRDPAKTRIPERLQKTWLPAVVEVLAAQAAAPGGPRATAARLEEKSYFDPGFLPLILSEVCPEVAERDELELAEALELLDEKLGELGLSAKGDRSWEPSGPSAQEQTVRFHAGLPSVLAITWAAEGVFCLFFLTELDDGTWVLTGLADDLEGKIKRKGSNGLFVDNPRVRFETRDEPLDELFSAHEAAVARSRGKVTPAPRTLAKCDAAFARFQQAAFA